MTTSVWPNRRYEAEETVEVGDVVTMEADSPDSFASSIVTHISPESVTLARPHAFVDPRGNVFQIYETFTVDPSRFKTNFLVYTTGHSGIKASRIL